ARVTALDDSRNRDFRPRRECQKSLVDPDSWHKDGRMRVKLALRSLVGRREESDQLDSQAAAEAERTRPSGAQKDDMSTLPPDDKSQWKAPLPRGTPQQQQGHSNRSRAIVIALWVGALLVFITLLMSSHTSSTTSPESVSYSTLLAKVSADSVKNVQINQTSGVIDGTFKNKSSFTA